MSREEMTRILDELQNLEKISTATESSMTLKRKHLENELLKNENTQLKSVLKEIREKCKEPKQEMDYTIWVKLRHQIETLEDFEKDIDYKTHPALTSAYKSDIKNAIKDLCQIIKYKLVYKEDIKEIIDKGDIDGKE